MKWGESGAAPIISCAVEVTVRADVNQIDTPWPRTRGASPDAEVHEENSRDDGGGQRCFVWSHRGCRALERHGFHLLSDAFLSCRNRTRRDFRSVWLQANNASNRPAHSELHSQLCGFPCRKAGCDASLPASSIHFRVRMFRMRVLLSLVKALESRAAALPFIVILLGSRYFLIQYFFFNQGFSIAPMFAVGHSAREQRNNLFNVL